MHARFVATLLVFTAFAGCTGDVTDDGDDGDPGASGGIAAPWWSIGRWWDVELQHGSAPKKSFRLVNFWNDTSSHHFWLGVQDRDLARDHALHDNNPILGRIHWELLTPHESGQHAHAMYTFPLKAGDTREGLFFGRTWTVTVSNGTRPGTLDLQGTATDGSTIRYDYDPGVEWWTFIEIKKKDGSLEMRSDIRNDGDGAHGTYWFLRGRDLYLKRDVSGTFSEKFDVPTESPPITKLAIEINGRTNGVLQIEFKNPQGQREGEAHTLAADSKQVIYELPAKTGQWTVSYTGGGQFTGTIEVVGLVEYTKTI